MTNNCMQWTNTILLIHNDTSRQHSTGCLVTIIDMSQQLTIAIRCLCFSLVEIDCFTLHLIHQNVNHVWHGTWPFEYPVDVYVLLIIVFHWKASFSMNNTHVYCYSLLIFENINRNVHFSVGGVFSCEYPLFISTIIHSSIHPFEEEKRRRQQIVTSILFLFRHDDDEEVNTYEQAINCTSPC
jgi:hypothetical protein